ncbi:hypothetical protein [Parathalassolituus penaei]|uniref:Uncharacterized protein n=1 Tax=Parathalassolituus penaei TaxID=2997323 RepID=A0A9X3EGQ2_9GAMM|nr:hypothetical protein [Parathalassolituus penaei]MCY0967262.1 hypothetical protein [Parathalassolituus penaei]
MSKSYINALAGRPWSLSELVFDLDDCIDDEGRPVSERRATMATRAGVEMDMRVCPYSDKRNGQWMNVSALSQVSTHYNEVMASLLAFRLAQKAAGEDDWMAVQAAVVDLLLQPVLSRLQLGQQASNGRIDAQAAVAHKLGAGFFGILRSVNDRYASGQDLPFGVESFLDFVERRDALVGVTEVCAGSPQMIRRACVGLFDAEPAAQAEGIHIPAARLTVARLLTLQVAVGTCWRLLDEQHWFRLCCGSERTFLQPMNTHLRQRLDFEHRSCPLVSPEPSEQGLPAGLMAEHRIVLQRALAGKPVDQTDVSRVAELLAEGPAVVRYAGDPQQLQQQIAAYLLAWRSFRAVLFDLEQQIRIAFWQLPGAAVDGLDANAGFNPGRMIFANPKALPWYECMVGCRMDNDGYLYGSSTGLRVPVRG